MSSTADAAKTDSATKDYSSFTVFQKRCLVLSASILAFISPLSSNIYTPALNTLATDYNVSFTLMNLTVTTYLIFQGLAPTFVGTFADDAGRRPAYMICLIVYTCANIGLSLQRGYAALLVLRMVQSAGSSGTVALASGVIADTITSSERGSYSSYAQVPAMLGPSLSPVLGGLLSQYLGWPWIFWFLTIFGVALFIPTLLFFPETNRKIVGDGTVHPPPLNQHLFAYLRERKSRKAVEDLSVLTHEEVVLNRRLRFPNPFSVFSIIFQPAAAILLGSTAILFICFYAVSISIPAQFTEFYGFDQLQISLMFVPIGGGALISSFTTGRLLNWNYARHARLLGVAVDRKKQEDLISFPIERARLEVGLPLVLLCAVCVIGYGWSVQAVAHLAVPIVLLTIMGYSIIGGFSSCSVLMTDYYRRRASTATAANNLVRCLLGAGATAVMAPLTNAVGIGWCCTIWAALLVVYTPFVVLLMCRGMQWRQADYARDEEKEHNAPKESGSKS